nr:MAG TPA: hypothetical protein [Bacteriophage sp.]
MVMKVDIERWEMVDGHLKMKMVNGLILISILQQVKLLLNLLLNNL